MILLAETKTTINGALEGLFEYVTNMENYGKWFPGVVSIDSQNDLPHGHQGKTYRELINMPEGEVSLTIEVKHCDQNKKFYTEGDLEPLRPAMLMEFDSDIQGNTLFSLKYYSRNSQLESCSEMIKSVKANLAERIMIAANNLQQHFNQ